MYVRVCVGAGMSAMVCVEVTGQPQGLVHTLHLETGSLLLFPVVHKFPNALSPPPALL